MKQRSSIRFIAEGLEGLAVALAVLITWPLSQRWLQDWGSAARERRRAWPGDELVTPEHTTYTRAVSVHAPASEVWPWLVQFGLGKAGFYSYELLERLVGIPVKNVESIVPEYQDLAVGDEILLHPKAPGVRVAALEKESHICFAVVGDPERPVEKPDPARSWSMYIDRRSARVSRLLLRSCVEPLRDRRLVRRLSALIEAPIDFIMEQRMLRTIKRLAESGSRRIGCAAVASEIRPSANDPVEEFPTGAEARETPSSNAAPRWALRDRPARRGRDRGGDRRRTLCHDARRSST